MLTNHEWRPCAKIWATTTRENAYAAAIPKFLPPRPRLRVVGITSAVAPRMLERLELLGGSSVRRCSRTPLYQRRRGTARVVGGQPRTATAASGRCPHLTAYPVQTHTPPLGHSLLRICFPLSKALSPPCRTINCNDVPVEALRLMSDAITNHARTVKDPLG